MGNAEGKPTAIVKPPAKRRAVREVQKVKVNGRLRWQVRLQVDGRRRSQLFDTYEEALAAKAKLRESIVAAASREQQAEEAPVTLKLICEAYVLDLEQRGKALDSIRRAQDTQARLTEYFGCRMEDPLNLTVKDLFAFRAHRLRQWSKKGKADKEGRRPVESGGACAGTVNRDLRTVRAMLKRPLPDFRFPGELFLKEDETRVRWLKPEDELLIFATMPAPFGDMARLAAVTMMRLSEIRTIRRVQVDLSQGIVSLPRTKTVPRHVVLSTEAQAILKRHLDAGSGEWVFPNPDGGPYSRVHVGRVWRKAAQAAGLQDFHFHDLRHHGATMALNAGFTAPIVMALGGWKTERMMRRYAAVTDKTLRAAAEAVSGNPSLSGNGEWQQAGKSAPVLARLRSSQG